MLSQLRARRLVLVGAPSAAALALGLLTATPALAASGHDAFTAALDSGPLAAAVAAFVGGLLVSLTPCVYPMIAVTVSVFGARQTQSRLHAITLSASFVLGIVAMFVPLGVAAGLTGGVFGAVLQNRWVVLAISVLFVALAASLFGAFDLALPSWLNKKLATLGGIGHRGAFLLGLASGLVAAPCTGPVLTGILAFIAKTHSVALGSAAMGAFALGLGVPFFLVGAFALRLPKSGRWLIHVKSLLGILLLVVALYFAATAWPSLFELAARMPVPWAIGLGLVVLGLGLGAIHRDFANPKRLDRVAKAIGIALVTVGGFVALAPRTSSDAKLAWDRRPYAVVHREAIESRHPMIVDFTASWCTACQRLEHVTFADPRVLAEARRFTALRVDATRDDDPAVAQTMAQLGVVGLPTVIVFDTAGHERRRINDFVTADELLDILRTVR